MAPRLTASFTRAFPGGPSLEVDLDLPLAEGAVTVLFGASGSGKTSVLRVLAGLDRPDTGVLRTDGETWFDAASGRFVPAHRRRVGLVFQEGALFPHLDVQDNIAFGLRGFPPMARAARVAELIGMAGLEGLERRRPETLSGGQRQRAALARALAPKPRLLLLDEPFASLDRPAQVQLRSRLRGLLRDMAIPAVLVTHDQEEALALGDRLVVLQDGRKVQEGAPAEVFSQPATSALAALVGRGTVIPMRISGRQEGMLHLEAGPVSLSAPDPGGLEGDRVHAWIRAEDVTLERRHGATSARNVVPAQVVALEPAPPLVRVHLDCGVPLEALVTPGAVTELALRPGEEIHAVIKAAAIRVLGACG
ncbi:MAG TPA: molybdenum ABC transporter ATP-binding protein [Holophagaceae bacterium]|nr:molybdenum ABC transporter ATP-binding protein [Holophagaceae bacterium]